MASRKCMPLITNYASDDSTEDEFCTPYQLTSNDQPDDEDNKPLSALCTPNRKLLKHGDDCVSADVTNPHKLSSSSDSSSRSGSDEEFVELASEFGSLPLTDLILSKQFTVIRNRRRRRRKTDNRIFSAYEVFFQEIQDNLKLDNPSASFNELFELAKERWQTLSSEDKQRYKIQNFSKSCRVTASMDCKTRLMDLCHFIIKHCSNSNCNKPITWDSRWNGQYCSCACVNEHCRATFLAWCASKRSALSADKNKTAGAGDNSFTTSLDIQNHDNRPDSVNPVLQSVCATAGRMDEARKTADPRTGHPANQLKETVFLRVPLFESLKSSKVEPFS